MKEGSEEEIPPLRLPPAARPYLVAALQRALNRPIFWLLGKVERARQAYQELPIWTSGLAFLFPEPDALPYERIPWSAETVRSRLAILTSLHSPSSILQPPIIVSSARALMQKTIPPGELTKKLQILRLGKRISLEELLSFWYALGYEPVEVVEEPGSYSRRGGILDIFPPGQPLPVRIELFGDQIESLRLFDPSSQRSQEKVDFVTIGPAREALPYYGERAALALEELDFSSCGALASGEFAEDKEALERNQSFRNIEFYLPYLYPEPGNLLEHLPQNSLVFIDDWDEVKTAIAELEAQALKLYEDLAGAGELPSGLSLPYFTWDELQPILSKRTSLSLGYDLTSQPPAGLEPVGGFPISRAFSQPPHYGGQLKKVLREGRSLAAQGCRVVLVSRQARRLSELLAEEGVRAEPVESISSPPPPRSLSLVQATLSEGWILDGEWRIEDGEWEGDTRRVGLVLLTDAEIFGWVKPQPRRPARPRGVAPESFFTDISPGDYVVHIEHGIGIFQGLVHLTLDGAEGEYLQVDYAAGDRLYVPIYQLDRLSRYVGPTDRPPTLNRLGATDWAQVKERARKAVEDIAQELLELYSAREVVPGHSFSPDTPWQAELEASFPYVETEDQLKAIEAVKTDMERQKPMDRLICGDVGYGKTEVALRAAFKAVMDGKQVALLVPTTVLAQQHYYTFKERLEPFPVAVEMLSRFRSRREQEEILAALRAGTVDIVIGTHRLLQEDVSFKDLGLLIIDEEQRFGVTHKERLKKMRTEVDVLTLTATPIPRTLYLSLSGVRDMSTINTPPAEHLPIKTHISEYDENLIRQAVLRELDRGGQVYFVHDRVQGINQIAARLAGLVPEARIAIAHGQMKERDLEQVMLDFVAGKIDVLVCTSIIESGLDIPNVNTIIINQAHTFGLAQLYQLRGRVGRGAVRAYAYLLYPKYFMLNEAARKRLQTILEASELGAGIQVAMRDLEIRGAGEILGARQHGHIAAVGFDLYCRLLAQAIWERKGESPQKLLSDPQSYLLRPLSESVQINLPMPTYLPPDYVPEANLRTKLYRRLADFTTLAEVEAMERELRDRFGPLPEPARNLLYQLRLKALALQAGVQAITTEAGQIALRTVALGDRHHLQKALDERLGGRARVGKNYIWLRMDRKKGDGERRMGNGRQKGWQADLEEVLRIIAEGVELRHVVSDALCIAGPGEV